MILLPLVGSTSQSLNDLVPSSLEPDDRPKGRGEGDQLSCQQAHVINIEKLITFKGIISIMIICAIFPSHKIPPPLLL